MNHPGKRVILSMFAVLLFCTVCLAQSKTSGGSKKAESNKKEDSKSGVKLTPIESPIEKYYYSEAKGRIISEELLNKYVKVYPEYKLNISPSTIQKNAFADKNKFDLIVALHDKYKIEDKDLEAFLESKLTPEERKMLTLKKEEEEKKKAALPATINLEPESIKTE